MVLVALRWPQKEWFACLLSPLVDEPLELPQVWNLLVQPHVPKFRHSLKDPPPSFVEVIQRLIRKVEFSRGVAKVVVSDSRCSTTALYQSKWF